MHKELLKIIQNKNNFLGFVSEREGLDKKIASNGEFSLQLNCILKYSYKLKKFNILYKNLFRKN